MIDACASSVALGGGSLRGDATTLKIVQVSPVFGLLCVKVAIFDCVDTAKAVYFVSLIESRVSSREWSTNSLKTEHPSSCQSNAAQFKCPAVSLPSSQVTCSLALGQKRRRSGSLGSMGGICRVRCGRDQARVRRFVRWQCQQRFLSGTRSTAGCPDQRGTTCCSSRTQKFHVHSCLRPKLERRTPRRCGQSMIDGLQATPRRGRLPGLLILAVSPHHRKAGR